MSRDRAQFRYRANGGATGYTCIEISFHSRLLDITSLIGIDTSPLRRASPTNLPALPTTSDSTPPLSPAFTISAAYRPLSATHYVIATVMRLANDTANIFAL